MQYEFWPEIDAYVGLSERARLLFSAAGTHATEASLNQRALAVQDRQFSANFDYTLAPVLRRDVPMAEWSKNRLLWTRLGFEYGTSAGTGSDDYRSYTGIVELNSRYSLQGTAWMTGRLRADFRDINGKPSQRYRVRVGAEWDEAIHEHPISPYALQGLLRLNRPDPDIRRSCSLLRPAHVRSRRPGASTRCAPDASAGRSAAWPRHPPAAPPR
jgi:hypothetical protein